MKSVDEIFLSRKEKCLLRKITKEETRPDGLEPHNTDFDVLN